MYGIEIPKQRGIYSEILTTEDTENLRVSPITASDPVLTFLLLPFRKFPRLDPTKRLNARSMRSKESPEPLVSFL